MDCKMDLPIDFWLQKAAAANGLPPASANEASHQAAADRYYGKVMRLPGGASGEPVKVQEEK